MSIKFISYGDTTGYGLSALAYLRGLLNRGVSVQWCPVYWGGKGLRFWDPRSDRNRLEIVRACREDRSLRDLPAIMAQSVQPKEYSTVIAHMVPEYLPSCLEAGKRNVAYCAWESDTIPAHWPEILNRFDAVLVPSHFNAEVFRAGGVNVPVHVVPHIRRHAIEDVTPAQRASLRQKLGLEENRFVFYSINAWMLRKDQQRMIEAFLEEFGPDEPVALVLKTSTKPVHFALPYEKGKTSVQRAQEIAAAVADRLQRRTAKVTVLSGDGISGALIDSLHQIGNAYLSLTRAEGWGMGAFEAALLGKPVLMTGWSGQIDFLGEDHPGLVDYTLEHIDWPNTSYAPHHRWAVADVKDARRKMRAAFERRGESDLHAMQLSERIANRFSEAQIMAQYCRILGV